MQKNRTLHAALITANKIQKKSKVGGESNLKKS